MAKPAYVMLNADGSVAKCHSSDVIGVPSAGGGDVETLINSGYQQKREIPLDGGKVLLVLEKP